MREERRMPSNGARRLETKYRKKPTNRIRINIKQRTRIIIIRVRVSIQRVRARRIQVPRPLRHHIVEVQLEVPVVRRARDVADRARVGVDALDEELEEDLRWGLVLFIISGSLLDKWVQRARPLGSSHILYRVSLKPDKNQTPTCSYSFCIPLGFVALKKKKRMIASSSFPPAQSAREGWWFCGGVSLCIHL
jgi:hypothetical protein